MIRTAILVAVSLSIAVNSGAAAADCLPTYPPAYSVNGQPHDLAIGDFDGDGDLDIVVVNFGPTMSLLLNQGDGTFAPSVPINGSGGQIVAVDIDADGDLDLVVGGGPIKTFFNLGGGTFSAAQGLGPLNSLEIAVGDMDADGDLDVISPKVGQPMLRNNGDGTFTVVSFCPDTETQFDIALGDFNGDGFLDTVAPAPYTDATVTINNGGGACGVLTSYRAGIDVWAVDVGDMDGDGDFDAVIVNSFVLQLSTLINQGGGAFEVQLFTDYSENGFDVALGDFDGDGDLDAAVASYFHVCVVPNNGPRARQVFALSEPVASGDFFQTAVATGDLDGNGIDDIVAADRSANAVLVLLNPCAVALGDLNGDGHVDSADIALLLGHWGACPPGALCPSDLDGDGTTGAADLGVLLGAWTG